MNEERIATASVSTGLAMTEGKPRTIAIIGAEIRTLSVQCNMERIRYGIEIGRRLVEAKELCKHGEWLNFLKNETEYSQPKASRLMQLYREAAEDQGNIFGPELKYSTWNNLSISKALRLLDLPEEERESFPVEVGAEGLSVRELEEKVRERTAEIEARARAWEDKAGEYASQINTLQNDVQDVLKQRNAEENAREAAENAREAAEMAQRNAEEQLRRIKAELDEIEKRPQATVYERDEEAIAKAANEAADAERAKHEATEKELKEQIAALAGQVKTESGNREKLEKQLREAEEKAAAAKKDGAEAEALRGEIEGLRKQLALAAPEVADFKAAFGRAQEELNHMLDAIAQIGDEETRGKLRKAGLAMMEAYAGRLGA